jgi:hypothetical protein
MAHAPVFTIATTWRWTSCGSPVALELVDERRVELRHDAFSEPAHDRELPPTERAAVVLRYGYDLSYDAIGAALVDRGGRRAAPHPGCAD